MSRPTSESRSIPSLKRTDLEAVDSWAVLDLMTFDRRSSNAAAGDHPMWIGHADGIVHGPFSLAVTLERLAVLSPEGFDRLRVSGDLSRWWELHQFVEMLGAPEAPEDYDDPTPPRPIHELEDLLRCDRPSGAIVVYNANGNKERALVVRSGKLTRDFGIRPLLRANARLLNGSLFEAMGVVKTAHRTLLEGRPLRAIAETKVYDAYDKARAILLRRFAADVLTRTDGAFILAPIARRARRPSQIG